MLITSISGIRGTVGGQKGTNLTPIDVVAFAHAYGSFLRAQYQDQDITVVAGRDARMSGHSLSELFAHTLIQMGISVIDCDLVPTPTVEMMVIKEQAQGGYIITASHNPKEYNGIKMLNSDGEFLSAEDGEQILSYLKSGGADFKEVDNFGKRMLVDDAIGYHISEIFKLDIIDKEAIQNKKFTIVVDGADSVGGIAIPRLLEQMDVSYIPLNCEPHGNFTHAPEPIEQNLQGLMNKVRETGADFGIAVDPDADRLVLVSNDGTMFGEEYTQVACADLVLSHEQGSITTNLSSSRAFDDIAKKHEVQCYRSAVGEKNVVQKMKEVGSIFGGEGSGGVIYPKLHYGRDALVGVALVLQLLVERNCSLSELRSSYKSYYMTKDRISIEGVDPNEVIRFLRVKFQDERQNTIDGLKIDFQNSWVHIRKSNTEPIVRIYTEAQSQAESDELAKKFGAVIAEFIN